MCEDQPSVSEIALGYVSGGLLGRTGGFPYPEIDPEGESSPGGPCRTHIRISKYPQFACVMGVSPGDSEGPTSLVGLTPEEMSLSQSNDPELGLILDWLGGELEPDEGELFLTSPAVKHYYINRSLLHLDSNKVLWKEIEEGGEKKKVLIVPRELRREVLRLCHEVPAA